MGGEARSHHARDASTRQPPTNRLRLRLIADRTTMPGISDRARYLCHFDVYRLMFLDASHECDYQVPCRFQKVSFNHSPDDSFSSFFIRHLSGDDRVQEVEKRTIGPMARVRVRERQRGDLLTYPRTISVESTDKWNALVDERIGSFDTRPFLFLTSSLPGPETGSVAACHYVYATRYQPHCDRI